MIIDNSQLDITLDTQSLVFNLSFSEVSTIPLTCDFISDNCDFSFNEYNIVNQTCEASIIITDTDFECQFTPGGEGGTYILPPATERRLGGIKVGSNLAITSDGTLSVITIDHSEKDNTTPITAAGVYTEVGNIEVLLAAL